MTGFWNPTGEMLDDFTGGPTEMVQFLGKDSRFDTNARC